MQCSDHLIRSDWVPADDRPGWIPGGEYVIKSIVRVHPYAQVEFWNLVDAEMKAHPGSVFVAVCPSKYGAAAGDVTFLDDGSKRDKGHIGISVNMQDGSARVTQPMPAQPRSFGLMGQDFTRRLFEVVTSLNACGCQETDYRAKSFSNLPWWQDGESWHEFLERKRDWCEWNLNRCEEEAEVRLEEKILLFAEAVRSGGLKPESEAGEGTRPWDNIEAQARSLSRDFRYNGEATAYREEVAYFEAIEYEVIDKGSDVRVKV